MRKAFDANVPKLKPRLRAAESAVAAPVRSPPLSPTGGEGPQASSAPFPPTGGQPPGNDSLSPPGGEGRVRGRAIAPDASAVTVRVQETPERFAPPSPPASRGERGITSTSLAPAQAGERAGERGRALVEPAAG